MVEVSYPTTHTFKLFYLIYINFHRPLVRGLRNGNLIYK